MFSLILFSACFNAAISLVPLPQSIHPLDPLVPAEIAVAIATVRAAGATPEVSYHLSFFTSYRNLIFFSLTF